MGRSTNQIATWKDLRDGLGYRLPYGVDLKVNEDSVSYLKKGVTYEDLYYCSRGYFPGYESAYASFSDEVKRMYVTKNAKLSDVYQVSNYTQYLVAESDLNKGIIFKPDEGAMHVTKDLVLYSFKPTKSFTDISVVWTNLNLSVSSLSACDVNITVLIKSDSGTTAWGRMLPIYLPANTSNKVLTLPDLSYFDHLNEGEIYQFIFRVTVAKSLNIDPGNSGNSGNLGNLGGGNVTINPGIGGQLVLHRLSFSGSSGPVSFSIEKFTSPDQLGEQGKKCVRYDQSKNNHDVTVPVAVSVKNYLSVVTYTKYIKFFYRYSLTTSPTVYSTIHVGGGTLSSRLWGKESASALYDIKLHPQVSGEIANDQLVIEFGDTSATRKLSLTLNEDGVSTTYTAPSATKTTLYYPHKEFSGKWYHSTMEKLIGVHGSIEDD